MRRLSCQQCPVSSIGVNLNNPHPTACKQKPALANDRTVEESQGSSNVDLEAWLLPEEQLKTAQTLMESTKANWRYRWSLATLFALWHVADGILFLLNRTLPWFSTSVWTVCSAIVSAWPSTWPKERIEEDTHPIWSKKGSKGRPKSYAHFQHPPIS